MTRKLILLLAGILGAALCCEIFLRLLPVSSGYRFLPTSSDNPFLRGTPGVDATYSKGWNFRLVTRGKLNGNGFRATYEYDRAENAVALIGDSYVQAAALSYEDTAYQVATRMSSSMHKVYGLGISGASLPDYLAVLGWVAEKLSVRTAFILLTDGDLAAAWTPQAGGTHLLKNEGRIELRRRDKAPLSGAERVLDSSMLFRYFFDNLGFLENLRVHKNDGLPRASSEKKPNCLSPPIEWTESASYLIQRFEEVSAKGIRIHFIVGPPRGRKSSEEVCQRDIDYFADLARGSSMSVIDLGPDFREATRLGRKVDFSPTDSHWNSEAHRIVAYRILSVLDGHYWQGPGHEDSDRRIRGGLAPQAGRESGQDRDREQEHEQKKQKEPPRDVRGATGGSGAEG